MLAVTILGLVGDRLLTYLDLDNTGVESLGAIALIASDDILPCGQH